MLRRKDVMSTITQWQLCTMFFTVLMPLAVESMERLPERERIKPPKDIERPVGKEERVEKYRYAEGKSIQPQQEPMISVGSIEKLQELATTLDKDRAVSITALDSGVAIINLVEHDQGPWLSTTISVKNQRSFMTEQRSPTQPFLTTMQRSVQSSLRRLSNSLRNIMSQLSFGTIAAFNVDEVGQKVNALSRSFKASIEEFKDAAQDYASAWQYESEDKDYQNKRLANAKKALVKSIEKLGDLNFSINEYLDTLNYKIEAGSSVGITPPGKQEEGVY